MLNLAEIMVLALAMSADTFCASLGIGGGKRFPGQTLRLAVAFGAFQGLMPVLGWLVGTAVGDWVRSWDHWFASGVMAIVGLHMLWEALPPGKDQDNSSDRSRGWPLLGMAVATSIDALTIGVVFGVVGQSIVVPALAFTGVTAVVSALAVRLGRRLKARFGQLVEVLGALLVLGVAVRLLSI